MMVIPGVNPRWQYTEHCHACGNQYITSIATDMGYCSEVCELNDWDEDE